MEIAFIDFNGAIELTKTKSQSQTNQNKNFPMDLMFTKKESIYLFKTL